MLKTVKQYVDLNEKQAIAIDLTFKKSNRVLNFVVDSPPVQDDDALKTFRA